MVNNLDKEIFTDTKYYGWIYMILNKIDGKIYVGQTMRDYNIRWDEHKKELKGGYHNNKHLQGSWNKYGEDNFEFITLHELEFNNKNKVRYKLNELEKYYIYEWNLLDDNYGYNMASGGSNGYSCAGKTEEEMIEIKRKMSESQKKRWEEMPEDEYNELCNSRKGKNNPMYDVHRYGECSPSYGKHPSEETKQKISEALKGKMAGENHPLYGTHHSEETKNKISKSRKGKYSGEDNHMFGKHHTDETKEKIRNELKGKFVGKDAFNIKRVAQIDKDTNEVIEVFDCIADANRKFGKNSTNIYNCANPNTDNKIAYGYKWRLVDDDGNILFFESDYIEEKILMIDRNTDEIIKVFNDCQEANLYLSKNKYNRNIYSCINGDQPTAWGYKWKKIVNKLTLNNNINIK